MSANAVQNPPAAPSAKSKKSRKKKNKVANGQKPSDTTEVTNGADGDTHDDEENDDEGAEEDDHPVEAEDKPETNGNGKSPTDESDTVERLEIAAKERDDLRKEVTELRKELEEIQKRHEDETSTIRSQLDQVSTGKEHAEARYQKLLGQVNTIKAQLGERLKSDAAELDQARQHIDALGVEKQSIVEEAEKVKSELAESKKKLDDQNAELASLRGRSNLSQQNWAKERDELITREAQAREEFESARQGMADLEVLAMEERSVREGLSDRVAELEDQVASQREFLERANAERDSKNQIVDSLQRALKEINDARKEERRELVETSQSQIDQLRKSLSIAEETATAAQAELTSVKTDLERALPFEKEVKEKNLLIGKLRHEAVILNDHLTKALRFLKKGKPEDNVDRQLVTNHLLQFLALDRSDPKKFQVLQLISALLGWTEEQKESAGLARPGASTSTNIKVPLSGPFRRVSSTATLSPLPGNVSSPTMAFNPDLHSPSGGKETLAELWSDFLEREAEQGSNKGGRRDSRPGSAASTPKGPGPSGFFNIPPSIASPRTPRGSEAGIQEEVEK